MKRAEMEETLASLPSSKRRKYEGTQQRAARRRWLVENQGKAGSEKRMRSENYKRKGMREIETEVPFPVLPSFPFPFSSPFVELNGHNSTWTSWVGLVEGAMIIERVMEWLVVLI